MMADVPGPNERVLEHTELTRRRLLRDAMTIVGAVAAGVVPHQVFARQSGNAAPAELPWTTRWRWRGQ